MVQKRSNKQPRVLLTALAILLLVAGALTALELTNTTHIFHKQKATSGEIRPINHSPNPSATSSNGSHTSSGQKNPGPNSGSTSGSTPQSSTNEAPATPYGALVSNHKPGQNGTGTTEQSECITTPGARCYIKFTQGGIVKTLPAQTLDPSGATFWTWDVKSAGLTSGSWQITAVATLNNQTKTTTDQLPLEVQ